MDKKTILVAVITLLLVLPGLSLIQAKKGGTSPTDLLWAAIDGLQQQIDSIEQVPQVKKVVLFENKCGDWIGEYSPIMDTAEYSRISIHSDQAGATYALHYSDDGINWQDQGPLFTSETIPQDYFVFGTKYRMDLRTVEVCTSFTAYLIPW